MKSYRYQQVDVRWNSTYLMLERFISNKAAISLLVLDLEDLPHLSPMDWSAMEAILAVLKPIFVATQELQSRRTSIASVIPIYRSLVHILKKPGNSAEFNLENVRQAIANKMDTLMLGWRNNR